MFDERKLYTLMVNLDEYILGKDSNLYKNRYNIRVSEKLMKWLKNAITFYNNNYFTPKQLMLFVCNGLLFDDKFHFKFKDWDFKHISDIDKKFSPEQLKQDKKTIDGILNRHGIDLEYLMTINNVGEMIALELVLQKKISPIFVIRFKDRIVRKSKPSAETIRKLRIISALESVLKTELLKKDN